MKILPSLSALKSLCFTSILEKKFKRRILGSLVSALLCFFSSQVSCPGLPARVVFSRLRALLPVTHHLFPPALRVSLYLR